jgi:hypothetical protein
MSAMRPVTNHGPLLVGVGSLLAALASNFWWLQRNELPDGFQNEYEHVYTLTEVYFRIRDVSLADAWSSLWDGYYPPLNALVGSLGLTVFGSSLDVAIGSLLVFFVLLAGATFVVARRTSGPDVAGLALVLVSLYPGLYGNARRFEPNITLAAMLALAIGWLVLNPVLRRKRDAVFLGVLCGLGMLADRVVFAVYLAPVVLAAGYSAWVKGSGLRKSLSNWLVVAVVTLVFCAYYYLRFIEGHLSEITTQIGGEITSEGDQTLSHPPWTLLGIFYYPISWLDAQMGLTLGTFSLLGLLLYLFRARSGLELGQRRTLEAWLFGGLFIITLVGKKQAFYSLPLLAPVAIFAARGWYSVLRGRVGRGLLIFAVFGLGMYQLALHTFGSDHVPTPGKWSLLAGVSPLPQNLLGSEYTMAAAPEAQGLDFETFAEDCKTHQAQLKVSGDELPYIVVFSDSHRAYEGQVMPTVRLAMDSLLVEGVLMNGHAVEENGERAACFLYLTDSDEVWPSASEVRAHWARWGAGEPGEALQKTLASMRLRVARHRSWSSVWNTNVHAYTLDRPSLLGTE